jgi:hypothetical protein
MTYGSLDEGRWNRKSSRNHIESASNRKNYLMAAALSITFFCCLVSYPAFGPGFDKVGLGQTTVTVSTAPPAPSSLPIGWEIRYTSSGVPFYYDAINDITSFSPPAPVGYPTILNTPLFSQAYPALFPPQTLATNPPLHKWGQFGIGPAAYAPFGPQVTNVFIHSQLLGKQYVITSLNIFCLQIAVNGGIPSSPPGIIMNGGIAPLGSSWNTSAAFWAYKNPNTIPLGSTSRTAAAYANYNMNNV